MLFRSTVKEFGIDILSTMSDPYRETADFGANITRQTDDLPVCKDYRFKDKSQLASIRLWDPQVSIRMMDRLNAIKYFKESFGDEYPILGWIEGAWAELCDLFDPTEAMMLMLDEPETILVAMESLSEQAIRCALAQIRAGADIIGIGDAAASLLSPESYSRYVLPYEKRIIDAVHNAGARTKLHICGNVNHILESLIGTGSDIVDIDFMVDYERAIALSGNSCSICGHINPTEAILQGTPEICKFWTRFCIEKGNSRSIISTGCEVPKMSPYVNFRAIHEQILITG